MSDEEKESFDYHQKIRSDYLDDRMELMNNSFGLLVSNLGIEQFMNFFALSYENDENDEDGGEFEIEKFVLDSDIPDEPFVCYFLYESGFDRCGKSEVRIAQFVTEKELDWA